MSPSDGDPDRFLIPTLSRANLSRELSYPIGAEALSRGLHSVPQLREIALHFYTEHLARCPLSGQLGSTSADGPSDRAGN